MSKSALLVFAVVAFFVGCNGMNLLDSGDAEVAANEDFKHSEDSTDEEDRAVPSIDEDIKGLTSLEKKYLKKNIKLWKRAPQPRKIISGFVTEVKYRTEYCFHYKTSEGSLCNGRFIVWTDGDTDFIYCCDKETLGERCSCFNKPMKLESNENTEDNDDDEDDDNEDY